ncbi:hypothetical protein CPC08DRAFT_755329 [Agrocybe pediades]|nr:hypothetical protein CPC08DRAFT_755329 [Agrocybe pediades]
MYVRRREWILRIWIECTVQGVRTTGPVSSPRLGIFSVAISTSLFILLLPDRPATRPRAVSQRLKFPSLLSMGICVRIAAFDQLHNIFPVSESKTPWTSGRVASPVLSLGYPRTSVYISGSLWVTDIPQREPQVLRAAAYSQIGLAAKPLVEWQFSTQFPKERAGIKG